MTKKIPKIGFVINTGVIFEITYIRQTAQYWFDENETPIRKRSPIYKTKLLAETELKKKRARND